VSTFNIADYGAEVDTECTGAILSAIAACKEAGGGVVQIPPGTYYVRRQGPEPVILELPSNCTFRGEGDDSVLALVPGEWGYWRIVGNCTGGRNITVENLCLDGSQRRNPGSEHNHGVFFRLPNTDRTLSDLMIRDLLVRDFSGDGVGVSKGTHRSVVTRIRSHDIQRADVCIGDASTVHVSDCRVDLIHVEPNRGVRALNVTISDNHCQGITAGMTDGLQIINNRVRWNVAGNRNTDLLIAGNRIGGFDDDHSAIRIGLSLGVRIHDNTIIDGIIYLWGGPGYSPEELTRDIVVSADVMVSLNGCEEGVVYSPSQQVRRCSDMVVNGLKYE
jgi:polygalacturonase